MVIVEDTHLKCKIKEASDSSLAGTTIINTQVVAIESIIFKARMAFRS